MVDLEKIESSPDYISAYDGKLTVVIWNNALEKKYGISKKEALGSHLLELFPHIEGDFRVKCFQQSVKENKTFFFPSLPYQFANGLYTQLIIPGKNHDFKVISIVRDHQSNERFERKDLLAPILEL